MIEKPELKFTPEETQHWNQEIWTTFYGLIKQSNAHETALSKLTERVEALDDAHIWDNGRVLGHAPGDKPDLSDYCGKYKPEPSTGHWVCENCGKDWGDGSRLYTVPKYITAEYQCNYCGDKYSVKWIPSEQKEYPKAAENANGTQEPTTTGHTVHVPNDLTKRTMDETDDLLTALDTTIEERDEAYDEIDTLKATNQQLRAEIGRLGAMPECHIATCWHVHAREELGKENRRLKADLDAAQAKIERYELALRDVGEIITPHSAALDE